MEMRNVVTNPRLRKKMRSKPEKIFLEDYLLLIQSRSHLHLNVNHLNQIISMHGYKKIHKVHKKLLSDAVSTLDLVEPSRSTLRDYISPTSVTVSIDDVISDLGELDWQECHLTSVEILHARNQQSTPPSALDSSMSDGVVSEPLKKLTPRRKKRSKEVTKRQREASLSHVCGAAALAWDCVW